MYYGTLLPYWLGVCNASIFTNELNSHAQSYYTNPDIDLSNKEADEDPFASFEVQRLPYHRGFMYLVKLDVEIRRTSHGNRSLDDVVLELLERRDAGEAFGVDKFLSLVSKDQQVAAEYRSMASGKQFQISATDSMSSAGLTLRRVDMPPWELGFEVSTEGTVANVKRGSRAADAGLLLVDRILEVSDFNWTVVGLEKNVTILVHRLEGQPQIITFWPRAKKTVEGNQWDLDEEGCAF